MSTTILKPNRHTQRAVRDGAVLSTIGFIQRQYSIRGKLQVTIPTVGDLILSLRSRGPSGVLIWQSKQSEGPATMIDISQPQLTY
eukprot:3743739-Pyramimonas_sp.AAC.1